MTISNVDRRTPVLLLLTDDMGLCLFCSLPYPKFMSVPTLIYCLTQHRGPMHTESDDDVRRLLMTDKNTETISKCCPCCLVLLLFFPYFYAHTFCSCHLSGHVDDGTLVGLLSTRLNRYFVLFCLHGRIYLFVRTFNFCFVLLCLTNSLYGLVSSNSRSTFIPCLSTYYDLARPEGDRRSKRLSIRIIHGRADIILLTLGWKSHDSLTTIVFCFYVRTCVRAYVRLNASGRLTVVGWKSNDSLTTIVFCFAFFLSKTSSLNILSKHQAAKQHRSNTVYI